MNIRRYNDLNNEYIIFVLLNTRNLIVHINNYMKINKVTIEKYSYKKEI